MKKKDIRKTSLIYSKIYKIFGKVLMSDSLPKVEFKKFFAKSIKVGKWATPDIAYRWLYDELDNDSNMNYNSSFYRDFEEVRRMDRLDIWMDQIRHYASTYGTDFQGEAWLPERTKKLPKFEYNKLTRIESMDIPEFQVKLFELVCSGIAMSRELIDDLIEIIDSLDWSDLLRDHFFKHIKNRELRYILRSKYNILEYKDGQDCLMQLLYEVYGISMLVKEPAMLDLISEEISRDKVEIMKRYFTDQQSSKLLASVFLRNKDIFLRMKSASKLSTEVNRLRKMAKKLHKPLEKSLWLQLENLSKDQRLSLYKNEGFFKLMQVLTAYINSVNSDDALYVIRNGKSYFKVGGGHLDDMDSRSDIIDEIFDEILRRVRDNYKGKTVKLPTSIELAVPTSEKNFIGDIPYGSSIYLKKDFCFGIYWRNEWGAYDLDLHAMDLKGDHIGWNSKYHNSDITFSGDMTQANPEAVEVFSIGNNCMDLVIKANVYNGSSVSKFQVIFAEKGIKEGVVIDPTKIKFKADLKFPGTNEMTLGFVVNKRFIFTKFATANSIVPRMDDDMISHYITYMKNISQHSVMLEDLLREAGVNIIHEDTSDEVADFDLSIPGKAELIRLFSI